MTALQPEAAGRLREEILEAARQQRKAILDQARQQAAAIVAGAQQAADQFRAQRHETAQAEAARRTEAILATVPVEVGRLRSARVEQWLEAIRDHAAQQLRTVADPEFRDAITRLAAEALESMAGDSFRLWRSAADGRRLGNDLAAAIQPHFTRRTLHLQIAVDDTLKEGEIRLEDEAARQVWHLGLLARLERCWPDLRRQIAGQLGLTESSDP